MYQPQEVRIAINTRMGRFKQYPVETTFAPGQTDISIAPPTADIVWQIFVVNYGELTPGPPTSNFYFVQRQVEVKEHNVPMVHSVLDSPYPLWVLCTQSNPLSLEAHNNTGVNQTLDIAYYLVTFDRNTEWAKWISDLMLLGFQIGIDDDILAAVALSSVEFTEILEARQGYWIDRHGLAGPLGAYYRLDQVVSRLDRLISLLELLPGIQEQLPPAPETPEASLLKVLKHPDPEDGVPECPVSYPEEEPETESPVDKVLKWPEA